MEGYIFNLLVKQKQNKWSHVRSRRNLHAIATKSIHDHDLNRSVVYINLILVCLVSKTQTSIKFAELSGYMNRLWEMRIQGEEITFLWIQCSMFWSMSYATLISPSFIVTFSLVRDPLSIGQSAGCFLKNEECVKTMKEECNSRKYTYLMIGSRHDSQKRCPQSRVCTGSLKASWQIGQR